MPARDVDLAGSDGGAGTTVQETAKLLPVPLCGFSARRIRSPSLTIRSPAPLATAGATLPPLDPWWLRLFSDATTDAAEYIKMLGRHAADVVARKWTTP